MAAQTWKGAQHDDEANHQGAPDHDQGSRRLHRPIAVDDREIERDRRRALKLKAANARYSAVFELFDTIETAQHRVKGVMGVVAALLDTNGEIDDAAALTMERHMQRDMAELDAAVSAARAAILDPLGALLTDPK